MTSFLSELTRTQKKVYSPSPGNKYRHVAPFKFRMQDDAGLVIKGTSVLFSHKNTSTASAIESGQVISPVILSLI